MESKEIAEQFHSHTLDGVDPSLQHFLKFLPPSSETPRLKTSTRGMYVDVTELPEKIDFNKVIVDLDLFRDIVTKYDVEIDQAIKLFRESARNTDENLALDAARICAEIGLTEQNFSANGGGFLFLLAVVLLASGCVHCSGGKPLFPHPRSVADENK
jgi:hypothetical protein